MVQFDAPRDPSEDPQYDPHWVMKRDLANCITRYSDKGDHETAAIYTEILDRYNGVHPGTLF